MSPVQPISLRPLPKNLTAARLLMLLEWVHAVGQVEDEPQLQAFLQSMERADAWIKTGAQPTETVRGLLKKAKAL